ncbi:50S ribosomal protein L21 [Alphaproteobacteria bacterium]|nr:50S ribosomal protein L21 [Alphaproteobacteria bacterium]
MKELMLAVFKTGGKQYSVKAGQILKVEKLEGEKGDSISFKDVLAISESTQNTIGSPLVEGAVVEAKILDQIRDKKIIVFKKRKRQNYRSTQGHRQYLTVLKIETISMGGKKSVSEKKDTKTETPVKKTTPKKKAAPKKAAPKETAVKKTAKKKTTTPKEDK